MSERLIGKSVPRVEDDALLRGRGRFVDDIDLPGMLHIAFVRSPLAHARVGRIDTSVARAVPGVHAVLTADDLKPFLKESRLIVALPSPSIRLELNRPSLAEGEVVHVGEGVAAVVAESRYIAEDAAALVTVDYDPLPVVADCRAALETGAPSAHSGESHNLLADFRTHFGDPERAFAQADHVFRARLWQHRGGGHSIECRGEVAVYDALEDKLTLWSSTQAPHAAKTALCQMLGRPDSRLRVVAPDLGGGFGPKLVFYPESVVVAVATMKLGRPVKWIEDRREYFIATTQERDQFWDLEIAVDGDARILGVRGGFILDHGAYTARGLNVAYGSAHAVVMPYNVPSFDLTAKLTVTNKIPVTPVRGAGQPQGVFAMERLLDIVASELGLDRAEVRRRNLIRPEDMPLKKGMITRGGIEATLDSGDFPATMEAVLRATDWDGFPERQSAALRQGKHIGIGMANFVEATGRGPFEPAAVRIDLSGNVEVRTGATAMGQGTRTMMAQIVGDQLGVEVDDVFVVAGDTDGTALGIGGFNSRQTVMAGSSALLAAKAVRAKLLKIAALSLDVPEESLDIADGRVFESHGGNRSLDFAEIARAVAGQPGYRLPDGMEPGLEVTSHFMQDAMTYAHGSVVVEVAVDVETGIVSIERVVFAHDCGRQINPMIVEGQIHGGVAHGIGNALFERMGFDENGQPTTTNLGEYLLIGSCEMPPVLLLHQETATDLNPLGAKGVGEAGVVPTPAAVISAVENALSPFRVRIEQTPISPQEIVALVVSADGGAAASAAAASTVGAEFAT